MGILDGLNEEQRAAVEHNQGPQLVVAGAGTGKTQVITRRIAHLIAEGHARPQQILALTFTEKAAREMEERLYELIGWESFSVPVLTFNAFGSELLGRYASHIGRSVRGGLLNETQKTLLLQQHLSRVDLQYYGPQDDVYEFIDGVVSYIGQLQNQGITATAYSEFVAKLLEQPGERHPKEVEEQADLARLYTLYEEVKREAGVYDYSDQLALPLHILQTHQNVADRLAQEYQYVLVDEYQDTNAVQDALLRTFVGRHGNIFAVGDDDQAIYGFRGADINNILAFAEHFDVPAPAVLVRNYRSGQAVLDASYKLIQHNNPHRLEEKLGVNKRLIALHDESQVAFAAYRTAVDEREGVLEQVAARLERGEPGESIAVLAATHAPLRAFAAAMARRGLPYAISTSVSIFDQPELLALWYLLKWLVWEASEDAIGHCIMGPFVGWSADQYREILEVSRQELVSIEQALRQSEAEAAVDLVRQLDEWRGWALKLPVSQLGFRLVFESGLAQQWQQQAESSPRMVQVFEDLQRLFGQMQDFETVALSPYLAAYSVVFPRPPALEVSEPVGEAGGVQLLTVHAAKGLEFETVYLVGCTQRTWSGVRSGGRTVPPELNTRPDLPPDHEFRRLMYVAVTRAKRELVMSAPVATAAGSRQLVSPFISEMLGKDINLLPIGGAKLPDKPADLMSKLQRFYPLSSQMSSDRLPFENSEGWLDLGVTALAGYDFCPFEFFVQHVLKISQPMGPQLGFGSILHKTFETYYKSKLAGTVPKLQELQLMLDEGWSNRGYASRTEAEHDLAVAHRTLKNWYEREEIAQRVVVGSEVPVRFEITDAKLRLRGKIDALFERPDGYEIRDFKTGRTKYDTEKLSKAAKENFQLRSYATALEQLRGVYPAAVVLDYVVTGAEGEALLTPAIMRNHRDKLALLAERIRARDFAPNPSAMHQCAAITYYGTGEADEAAAASRPGGTV